MKIPSIPLLCILVVCAAVAGASPATAQSCPEPGRQPATEALIALIDADPDLGQSLEASFALGQKIIGNPELNPVVTLQDYYDYIDALVTYNPQNIDTGVYRGEIRVSIQGKNYCRWNLLDLLTYGFFLVDRQLTTDPRGQIQFKNQAFSDWMRHVAEYWGQYLETPASAIHVPDFKNDPLYGDWACPAEPYATFQDYFIRELCPVTFPSGTRPVHGLDDPTTVVSIGDSVSAGWWPISTTGKLVTTYDTASQAAVAIKGIVYSDVPTFILGGDDEHVLNGFGDIDPSRFNGGVFTHQFLNTYNYHRLHTPIAGRIVYMRHFQAAARMKAGWIAPTQGQPGYYGPMDPPDWQFGQTRLVLGIETPDHGIVLAAPMGMAQVSGIVLRDWVQLDAQAEKGWEFANFAFGGSDFVIIFQPQADFVLTVPESKPMDPGAGTNYEPSDQGEKYGCFGGVTTCDDTPGDPGPYPRS